MNYTELTDEQLLQEKKKIKSGNILNAVLIGVLMGVAIYSTVKKGLGFFTFFPLFFMFLLLKRQRNMKELENELKTRNLK